MNLIRRTRIWRGYISLSSRRAASGYVRKAIFVVADTSTEARGKIKEWAKEQKKVIRLIGSADTIYDSEQGIIPYDGIEELWPIGGKKAITII